MYTKLLNAIAELKKYYQEFENLEINEVIYSSKTYYKDKILYCSSLNSALLYLVNFLNETSIELDTTFTTFGTMIDLSRNAVFKVDYMKDVIRKQALLGINKIMLYTEDVYEVDDEPYFGYMRGRYNKNEIQEIVEYASIFDIEVIPCIQTLGHFGQFLRWGYNSKLKDQQTVIMTEIEESYQFIEKCIKSVREMYKTNTIHIGLDETFGFGLGKYYKKFGYKDQYELFINHLNKVNEICDKYGFKDVLIWSDMLFRMSSVNDEYYDLSINISDKVKQDIPENVSLVYWDYYNYKNNIVDGMLKKHLDITSKVIMASGTWIWTKLAYDKVKTDKTAVVHIDVCKENDIKDIYFTEWNDDGAPCNYETVFLGLFDMANHALAFDKMPTKVYDFIMNKSYKDSLLISKLNESPLDPLPLLWDDPLLGIFINNESAKNDNVLEAGLKFFEKYVEDLKRVEGNDFEHKHALKIAELLYAKVLVRKELTDSYHNKKSLKHVIPLCETAIKLTEGLLESFRKMWLTRYKAFGLDVIQSRLATLIYRYKELIMRINDYENNKIDKIEELDELVGPHQILRMNHMNIAYSSIHVQSY